MFVWLRSPVCPADVDWSLHFPAYFSKPSKPEDIDSEPAQEAATASSPVDVTALVEPIAKRLKNELLKPSERSDTSNLEPLASEHSDDRDVISRNNAHPQVRFADVGCGFGGLLGEFEILP